MDFASSFGNFGSEATKAKGSPVIIILIVIMLISVITVFVLFGLHLTKGWFRKKLPGESCKTYDDGTSNCGDSLACVNGICSIPSK